MGLHPSTRLAAVASFALPLAVACSLATIDKAGDVADPTVNQDEPIITGSKDTGHPAVVLLQMTLGPNSYASCTGTIIATDPATHLGSVLTAGHCIRGATDVQVVAGNELSAATGVTAYAVADFKAHPQFDGSTGSPYDVAMVRIFGVDANTPVIPLMTQDNLAVGQRVTSVGFGMTVHPDPGVDAGNNTAKNKIDGTIDHISGTQVQVRYDNNGDICHGDSGGPVIVNVSGKDYVAAVHSFVTGACYGDGYSVRASSQAAFYNSIISQAAPAPSCDTCRKNAVSGTQVCATERAQCSGDADCGGLLQCLNHCAQVASGVPAGQDAGTADCQNNCVTQFPYGRGPYNHLVAFCSCNECESQCSGDSSCASVPKCGVKYADTTCNSCMEGSCCAQNAACGPDGHCAFCLKNPTAPECATNQLFQAVKACRTNSCGSSCTPLPNP
jgi:hypothetical protein